MTDAPAPFLLQGRTGDWEVIIGMEVHARVAADSKLFSSASANFGADENEHVSLVDAAFPGMLPVLNEVAVTQAVRTGLGLQAQINLVSVFDRKNYFYPDLPQGYQISQFSHPIVGQGALDIFLDNGQVRRVGITRVHLEQDAGKSMHDQHPSRTFIDLNRAGTALMEIVSDPDLRSPEEAAAYLKTLRILLRTLGTCDGNMDQGSMRADVNVSVRKVGAPLGTRCEIKNINSMRFVQQAALYEALRQIEVLEDGGSIVQETRLFDHKNGETRSMRGKEDAHDYRYFPDPDLLPVRLTQQFVDDLARNLPELPVAKYHRLIETYGLAPAEAILLAEDSAAGAYFETAAKGRDGKKVAAWLVGELFALLNAQGLDIAQSPISPQQLGQLVDLMANGTISGKIAKTVFELMHTQGGMPADIVQAHGLVQISDTSAIAAAIDAVLASAPDKVAEFRSGKDKLLPWFVGQVMKATQGKADPALLNTLLGEKLRG